MYTRTLFQTASDQDVTSLNGCRGLYLDS